MKVVILSGKGGTGKTFVAVNLAASIQNSVYIDCDVEEPNGHLFFKPENLISEKVYVKKPIINELCNGCRKCVEFCKFNALAYVGEKVKVFNEVCHSCGGCVLLCPQKAVKEFDHEIGIIQTGMSNHVKVKTGILNIGETSGIKIVQKLLEKEEDENHIIDGPPGSACMAMETVTDADYCILVAEPTIYGLHNLKMIYELVKLFNKPLGVVINKSFEENDLIEQFCKKNKIEILTKIPFDSHIGNLNSTGNILVNVEQKYQEIFVQLFSKVKEGVEI